jgi:hypothetical protein
MLQSMLPCRHWYQNMQSMQVLFWLLMLIFKSFIKPIRPGLKYISLCHKIYSDI